MRIYKKIDKLNLQRHQSANNDTNLRTATFNVRMYSSLDRHNGVRFFKGRELSPCKNNEGNPIVSLRGLTKSDIVVNQLVAQTFLPPVTGARSVRHIDGDRSNNHVSNLEWVIRKVRLPKGRGRKLDPSKVACIRASIAQGVSLTELSNRYQVHLSMISRIKSNKAWKDNAEHVHIL